MSARQRQASPAGRGIKGQAKRPKCPICGKPRVEEHRPFCSKRCADIDLGRWLEGRYAVPGEPITKDDSHTDDDR